ncbi:hypothetical protein [Staphylococcus pasteuri]|uniref:hypothetical protein n=1 Tax=Staphylococcus pasteuri TaxID=45972 RepID=UPI000F82B8CD|nr:hypothetical protein [Staphylococcus pasteuri]QDW84854.1 hypothetical protein DWB95_08005 [Staphylococcus pasteuri]QQN53347.1 hypothetical protein I6I26_08175 [Staphylococcus pasteuri]RTX70697.1 hypothetical protein CD121_11770 [Staphylococcus pasteuri]
MNVSLQTSFKTLIIYCCVSTFMILNNKDALLLADEMNSPSANSYNTQQDNPQKLDEAIFKELPKKTNNIYLDVRDKDDKKVEVFDEKGRLIFNSKNQVYLEIKLSPHTKIENYQFLTSNSQPLPFVTKSNDDTTTIRILLKQNIQTLEMRYKQNLHDKEDSVLFIHLKQNKDDKEDQKDKNQNQIIVQQNKNNNQQTRTTDKDISKNKKTGQNKPKEYKNSTQEQKNKSTTTNINVTKNSNSSHTQSSGNSNNNDQSLKNNVDSQSTKIQSTRDNIKKEKDKTLPSFNRDDDVKKHKPNNKKYENNQKAKSHKKEYAILGVAIVLAMLLLVVSHLLMRKRGKKD